MKFAPALETMVTPIAIALFAVGYVFAGSLGINSAMLSGFAVAWVGMVIYGTPKPRGLFQIKSANIGAFIESSWSSWIGLLAIAGLGFWLTKSQAMLSKWAGFAVLSLWLLFNTGFALLFRESIRILWYRARPLGLLSVVGLLVAVNEASHFGWMIAFAVGLLLSVLSTFLGFHGRLNSWWSIEEQPDHPQE